MKLTVKELKSLVKEIAEQRDSTDEWTDIFINEMNEWTGKKIDSQMAQDVLWCLVNSSEVWSALQYERRNHKHNMEDRFGQ